MVVGGDVQLLGAEQPGHAAGAQRGGDLGVARDEGERVGIAGDHAARHLDLLELQARVARRAGHGAVARVGRRVGLAGDVHRPELSPHHALPQARDVRHAGRLVAEVVRHDVARVLRVVAHGPRQVVVPVDER